VVRLRVVLEGDTLNDLEGFAGWMTCKALFHFCRFCRNPAVTSDPVSYSKQPVQAEYYYISSRSKPLLAYSNLAPSLLPKDALRCSHLDGLKRACGPVVQSRFCVQGNPVYNVVVHLGGE